MSHPRVGLNCDTFSQGGIVGLRPAYAEAVMRAGGVPMLLPCGAGPAEIESFLDAVDVFVLTGGDDIAAERLGVPLPPSATPINPRRDKTDFLLVERLLARPMPTLAICLGMQELNAHLGGTLYLDLPSDGPAGALDHGDSSTGGVAMHEVKLLKDSRLSAVFGADSLAVSSCHHQAVRDAAPGLLATAWAPDGVIEALEVEAHPWFVGVQWHPEKMRDDPMQAKLFAALLEKA